MKDFGVLVFVSGSQLSANPFVYKNAVIGVRVSFDHVVSESEALFNGVPAVGNGMLFTRVSSTMFDGPGDVLAAGKVVGLQTIKNRIGGDVSVPLLELIGVYNCANGACSGFWSE